MLVDITTMVGRPKKDEADRDFAVPASKAKPGDRVIVQIRIPYDVMMGMLQEYHRRGAVAPKGAPGLSGLYTEALVAWLAGKAKGGKK